MKKCIYFSCFVLAILTFSCNDQKMNGHSEIAQKNLDAMKGVRQAIESKDLNKLGDFISADAVDHSGAQGDIKGLDSIKMGLEAWTTMAEEKAEVIRELADDDYVMSWIHDKGKYKTDGEGHKAGQTFDMESVEVAKFSNGKITEHWTMMQPNDVMKMMASTTALPTTTVPTVAADTAKRKK
jgi:predicted SnoaL-like aldol condensation-catalyzing enzyme